MPVRSPQDAAYVSRLVEERRHYDNVVQFDDLPPIFHYWSHTYVRPMLEPLGCSCPQEMFARYLRESAQRCAAERPVFASIGSGDGNNELEIARLLKHAELADFTMECLEMNPALIAKAAGAAQQAGLASHLVFVEQDFNAWQPSHAYHGVMANQSLHHVTNLEGLFDAIREALDPHAYFVTSDIVGRKGHQRWPEARRLVERYWRELPPSYRFHRQLERYEEDFEDWDCSSEGFEGIRSQDVLPLLLERFFFHVFIGFGSVIDPFVDRGFGPNFDAGAEWDRAFIDRVHACDEHGLLEGYLTPTHMMAVMSVEPGESPYYARGLSPEVAVRRSDRVVIPNEMEAVDRALAGYFCAPKRRLPLRGCVRQIGDIRDWHEDHWVGPMLEFTVMPEREVSQFSVYVTLPEAVPEGTELSVEVDGSRVRVARAGPNVALDCTVRLVVGEAVTIRIATTATVNLKERGLGADMRDLGFHLDAVVFES